MTNDLAQLAEEFGVLKHVGLTEFEPGWITAVRLQFERGELTIEADDSDDTIRWEVGEAVEPTTDTPSYWLPLLEGDVRWVWVLTNHRGFRDALQLEFSRDRQFTYLQFIVEGSRLWIYRLEAFERPLVGGAQLPGERGE
jgi:hypothetical protein